MIEGPFAGYKNDPTMIRDSQIRQDLEINMQQRVAAGQARLKVYGDKIFNNNALVVAAWSRRHGPLQPWMTDSNSIMSPIRVAIEWGFKDIVVQNKYIGFAMGQKLQENRTLGKYYLTAVLLANARVCLYGGQHLDYFGVQPPTLEDYLG